MASARGRYPGYYEEVKKYDSIFCKADNNFCLPVQDPAQEQVQVLEVFPLPLALLGLRWDISILQGNPTGGKKLQHIQHIFTQCLVGWLLVLSLAMNSRRSMNKEQENYLVRSMLLVLLISICKNNCSKLLSEPIWLPH